MEEDKQICMETSLRAEQTLATATALVHVDMRAWETSERVQQQRRKVLPSPQHIHIKALQPGACLTQSASAPHEQAACGRSDYPKDWSREPGWGRAPTRHGTAGAGSAAVFAPSRSLCRERVALRPEHTNNNDKSSGHSFERASTHHPPTMEPDDPRPARQHDTTTAGDSHAAFERASAHHPPTVEPDDPCSAWQHNTRER